MEPRVGDRDKISEEYTDLKQASSTLHALGLHAAGVVPLHFALDQS
jgi:hypothetical protein